MHLGVCAQAPPQPPPHPPSSSSTPLGSDMREKRTRQDEKGRSSTAGMPQRMRRALRAPALSRSVPPLSLSRLVSFSTPAQLLRLLRLRLLRLPPSSPTRPPLSALGRESIPPSSALIDSGGTRTEAQMPG